MSNVAMTKIPIKLGKDLILEAILELRFSTQTPAEVIFGAIYQSAHSGTVKSTPLPILQIPEVVRKNDPNLKYQPHWKIDIDTRGIWIGPSVISFSISSPYVSWVSWKSLGITRLSPTAHF